MSKTSERKERKLLSGEASARRKYIWRHNGYGGSAVYTRKAMDQIINSPSTTPLAKSLALQIQNTAHELVLALKTRIDPND